MVSIMELLMNDKKVEELEARVSTLEFALKQLEADVTRLLSAHGENVQTPAGAPPLKHEQNE
jgi:hypothetical protein